MNIVTTLTHTDKGRPQIVAKGGKKQKTVNYDHALSHDANHGIAAAALVQRLGEADVLSAVESIDAGTATHTTETGARHRFTL